MATNFRIYNPDRFNFTSILSRVQPCFGYPLGKASNIISIIHMVCSAGLAGLLAVVAIMFAISHEDMAKAKYEEGSVDYWRHKLGIKVLILAMVIIMLFVLAYFFLSRLLYKGVKENCYRKVNLWWKIMLVLTVALMVENIILAIRYKAESKVGIWEITQIIFFIYSLWVVHEYKRELQQPSESTVEFDRVLQMP